MELLRCFGPTDAPVDGSLFTRESGSKLPHSKLVGEGDADFVGDFEGVFDTSADGGAVEVVAREIETGEGGAKFFDGRETSGVAEIVLRESAGPDGDVGKNRLIANIEQWSNFAVNQSDHFLWRFLENGGIGDTAKEAGEQGVAFRSAAREERRIPDTAESVQA